MKKVAILQSNYLPWKGVFDIMHQVDVFVFLEDVQYTARDWRNRNKVLTDKGSLWISVPIKRNRKQFICEAKIDNSYDWQEKHFRTFDIYYSKALYYKEYKWIMNKIFKENKWGKLSHLNIRANKLIAQVLGIQVEFINSCDLGVKGKKDDKLIEICQNLEATHYLSGPAAKDYIIPEKFEKVGIELEYIKYEYPRYKQLHEPFNHHVTILDLLFNCGPDAPYYIWGWREDKGEIEYDTL